MGNEGDGFYWHKVVIPSISKVDEILAGTYEPVYYWDWNTIAIDISILLAGMIGWVVLLKYGIYRAILYIVYGRN